MSPQIIFGTATFGMDQTEFENVAALFPLLQVLKANGVKRLDSGARYPPLNPGRSEQLIGESKDHSIDFVVDTKVYTDVTKDGSGDLAREAIEKSVLSSLSRLQRSSEGMNVLHIHRSDPSTSIQEQVRGFNEQIEKGRCRAWGVSNVPVPMLEEMLRVCDEEGLKKPVCYQGEYNIISRGMETRLLPLLRKHGMVFNAFRPLAAGFMTGSFVKGDHSGSRFGDSNPLGKQMQKIYGDDQLHAAMKTFDEAVTGATGGKMSTMEVAIRWIVHHSALHEQDGVILGASKQRQVEQVLDMIQKGPLPEDVLRAADGLWSAVEEIRGDVL